jgi:hypothetical protein
VPARVMHSTNGSSPMAVHLARRSFLKHTGTAVLLRSVVGQTSVAQQVSDAPGPVGRAVQEVLGDPVVRAVRESATLMLSDGRDRYGPKGTPLFVGQLNVKTRRIPTGDGDDPGLLKGNAATAGTAHFWSGGSPTQDKPHFVA